MFFLFSFSFLSRSRSHAGRASAAKGFTPEEIQNPFFFFACQGHLSPQESGARRNNPWLPGLSRIWRINYLTPDAADNDNRFSRGNQAGFLFVLFISESAGACSLQKKKIIETEIL